MNQRQIRIGVDTTSHITHPHALALLLLLAAIGCSGSNDPSEVTTSGEGGSGNETGDGDASTNDAGDGDVSSGNPQTVVVQCKKDSQCDDGLICNGVETCQDGFCAAGEAVNCDDGINCTRDYCEPKNGSCDHLPPDADNDGHLDKACEDEDGETLGDDCDDDDANRYPGNPELCGLDDVEHDEDCDPTTYGERDQDKDGYDDFICFNVSPEGEEYRGEDCNDEARFVNPDNSEVCDGFDNNCDTQIDEGLLIVGYRDRDGDGFGVPVTAEDALPGEIFDSEGKLSVCPGTPAIAQKSVDCDDDDPFKRPDSFELCDGIDNNCNDEVDENVVARTWYADFDDDGFGNPAGPLRVSCERQIGYSLYPSDCDDTKSQVNSLQVELCDGLDNDCDGKANFLVEPGDQEDDDKDGSPDAGCGTSAPDCNDSDKNTRPGARELCDGVDNDCNGIKDTQVQSVLWYLDQDGDGWGNPLGTPIDNCDVIEGRVTQVGDCDDRDPTRNPARKDDCSGVPGSDDDCDGEVDEAEAAEAFYLDADGDGYGKLGSSALLACQAPAGWVNVSADCNDTNQAISPLSSEVCTVGDEVDDDCDGDIDCVDSDCLLHPDCVGLFQISLLAPATPVTAIIATPFVATVAVKTGTGTAVPSFDLDVACADGAWTTSSTVTTDSNGLATVALYPGLTQGNYECTVTGGTSIPHTIKIQALAPPIGSVHTVFNVPQANSPAPVNGESALGAALYDPTALAVASDGALYVLDYGKIFEVSPRGAVRDLLVAIGANAIGPLDLAMDKSASVLYILGSTNKAVYALNLTTATLTQVAGGGSTAFSEGMAALAYGFTGPHHIAVQPGLGVVVADTAAGNEVVLVQPNGTLSRFETDKACASETCITSCSGTNCRVAMSSAGAVLMTGTFKTQASANENILARLNPGSPAPAQLTFGTGSGTTLPLNSLNLGVARGLALDSNGHLLLAHDNRVRWIGKSDLVAKDLIGGTSAGSTGDYGPSTQALVQNVADVDIDALGNVWILEGGGGGRVRRIWKPTAPSTSSALKLSLASAAPTGLPGHKASTLQVLLETTSGAPVSGVPVFFESDASALTRQGPTVTSATGLATTNLWTSMVPGDFDFFALVEDLGGGVAASLDFTVDVSDPTPGTITSVMNVSRISTNPYGDTPNTNWAPAGRAYNIRNVATRDDGTIYFTSYTSIYRLGTDGTLTRVAGGGGSAPDNVPGLTASIGQPSVLQIDENFGRLYFANSNAGHIYVLELDDNTVWTLTGQGSANPENGPASQWGAVGVSGLAVNDEGTELAFFSGTTLSVIDLSVSPATRRTLVTAYHQGTCPGTGAVETRPYGSYVGVSDISLAYGPDDLLYATGTVCGGSLSAAGLALYSIDTSAAPVTSVDVLAPITASTNGGMDVDASGRVYFRYQGSHSVVRWNPDGSFDHLAGTGTAGETGDQGPATSALLNTPYGVALTPEGHLLIADYNNYTIRKVWYP